MDKGKREKGKEKIGSCAEEQRFRGSEAQGHMEKRITRIIVKMKLKKCFI
ncbi:MAG: hypothetical protein JXL67_06385 [Calditrichaeota bacterium]|nr:hypothetical protein [Calditrichota bacterium]